VAGDDVRVEVAGPDAWEVVRTLRLAALADAPDAFCATHDAEAALTEADWRDRLARPDVDSLVAWVGDDPAGVTVVEPWEDGEVAGVGTVWVTPAARGLGVGDALLTLAVDVARRRGYRRAALEVGDHNAPAQRLYARHGFTATGRTSTMPPPKAHVTEHELARDL
jgi:ribosomal protein S18 acetylase RimI-like enzyme